MKCTWSIFVFSLLIFHSELRSEESGYPQNIEQMMGSIQLEKKQVEGMLDMMVKSGRITSEEGVAAKRELASLKEEDMENLKRKAFVEIKSKKLVDP